MFVISVRGTDKLCNYCAVATGFTEISLCCKVVEFRCASLNSVEQSCNYNEHHKKNSFDIFTHSFTYCSQFQRY